MARNDTTVESTYSANFSLYETITTTKTDHYNGDKVTQQTPQLFSVEVRGNSLEEILEKVKGLMSLEITYANSDKVID